MNGWLVVLLIATPLVAFVIGLIVGRTTRHRHNWSKWVFFKDKNYYGDDRTIPSGRAKVYVRICEGCGLPETKEIDV